MAVRSDAFIFIPFAFSTLRWKQRTQAWQTSRNYHGTKIKHAQKLVYSLALISIVPVEINIII